MKAEVYDKYLAARNAAEREIDALTWLTTRTGADQDDLTSDDAIGSVALEQAAVNSIKDAMLLITGLGQQQRTDAMTELTAEYGDENGACDDELSWAAMAGRTANWTWNEGDAWEYRTSTVWSFAKKAAQEVGDQDLVEYATRQEEFWNEKETW